jgi:8-oxo-dGTP pyrophosphatase MutT (NUDIX family)
MSELATVLHHPDMKRLVRALNAMRHTPDQTEMREAAVVLILRAATAESLELLLILRAEFEGDPWSGNIGLPGGHRDPGDTSLEDAVVRETREEIGIDLEHTGRIIGRLSEVRPMSADIPGIMVVPYVAVVRPDVPVTPGPEVAEAFWVPLARLRQPDLWGEATVTVRGGPRQVLCFRHGKHIVWGLTERILRELLELLTRTNPHI